jgi:clan AA aspartic protease
MGLVHTEITLKNAGDVINVQRGYIQEKDVRGITVTALVDTGAITLVISGAVCRALGLHIEDKCSSELADGSTQDFGVTEPVKIHWNDRSASCEAVVMEDSTEALLGAIPLEALNLMIPPARQRLEAAHGSKKFFYAK